MYMVSTYTLYIPLISLGRSFPLARCNNHLLDFIILIKFVDLVFLGKVQDLEKLYRRRTGGKGVVICGLGFRDGSLDSQVSGPFML